jgi:hypothetical protein
MSGGLRWGDEFPSDAIEARIREDNWAFRYVWAYRASLIRGQPREGLRSAWDQLANECPEWPERRVSTWREKLETEEARFLREINELDQTLRS